MTRLSVLSRSTHGLSSGGEDWRGRARCVDADPEVAFTRIGSDDAASFVAAYCRRCEVKDECLRFALSVPAVEDRHGIFGGLTPTQRQRLREFGWKGCGGCGRRFVPRHGLQSWCSSGCASAARQRRRPGR